MNDRQDISTYFLHPKKNSNQNDHQKWLPILNIENPPFDFEEAAFILEKISSDFCSLYAKEHEAYVKYITQYHDDKNIIWKRPIDDLKETCDICVTTIFNYHWICEQCGLSVCLDCYEDRSRKEIKPFDETEIHDRDVFFWPFCGILDHSLTKMTFCQIIPDSCLFNLHDKLHQVIADNKLQNSACKYNLHYEQSSKLSSTSSLPSSSLRMSSSLPSIDDDILNLKYPCNGITEKNSFEKYWQEGKPIVITNISDQLNLKLWRPKELCRHFGKEAINVFDCVNNTIIENFPVHNFWQSFEQKKEDQPQVLKLKDWPADRNFSDVLPNHFDDFMRCLPFGKYTRYNGEQNLVNRLCSSNRPDMGPKLYAANAVPTHLRRATTKLHLDMADAVNVAVYASTDYSHPNVIKKGKLPAARWDIWSPKDTEKIRQFLKEIEKNQNQTYLSNHDPIHDQEWYLDKKLRESLFNNCGVRTYSLIQFVGDAVFIPAGAGHQVRNLSDSIKIAVDFVSPHNINRCVQLTDEFRKLHHTNSNHADKLQIKNIIYHSVKDAVYALMQGKHNYKISLELKDIKSEELKAELFFRELCLQRKDMKRKIPLNTVGNRVGHQKDPKTIFTRRQEQIHFNKTYSAFENQIKNFKNIFRR